MAVVAVGLPAGASAAAGEYGFVVNAKPGAGAFGAARAAVVAAGGVVKMEYPQIGVLVVTAADPGVGVVVRRSGAVSSAGKTRTVPVAPAGPTMPAVVSPPVAGKPGGAEPLESLQWGLRAIGADKAHQKTVGRRDVLVSVLDNSVDDTHPDLAPNFEKSASANCVGGRPDPTEGSWRPTTLTSSHGTSVAGIAVAARNGVGTAGVAPGVGLAAVKVASGGLYTTESVVCGLVWSAEHGADVVNMSFYVDPWYFNCLDDPDQRALAESVQRATKYAERKGTVLVAAGMNSGHDLGAPTLVDESSPGDGTPVTRTVDRSRCISIPAELPGVVTVAATGAHNLKSSYSNYGLGVIDIAAPGGEQEDYQPPTAPAVSNQIIAPVPGGTWEYVLGTSMATPMVAGVAALIRSVHPKASPAEVRARLFASTSKLACPPNYDFDNDGTTDATCSGSTAYNSFYGHGLLNAQAAVKR
ncbi:S8 family peptidase [Kribbella sandramycini]|uniref:Peptidase S8/S53 domain-containing protein n=1 Tax=Kribbella sandramycini TaxID=60450 RepID=A0A841SMW9_9ACTN|nr:hypothetical protein [Kribbella sandramycini]